MEATICRADSTSIALAAIHICQSLLLELEISGKMSDDEIQGLLKDVSQTLRVPSGTAEEHERIMASEIVEAIRVFHERLRL